MMNTDTLYRLIGKRIRSARSKADMSQAKLAEILDMSRTSVVNIEAGRQKLPLHVLWKIAEAIGTEAALLIPNQSEYQEKVQPVALSEEENRKIEEATNGDSIQKRDLVNVISQLKSRTQNSK